jgi:Raf kinase inhibitor-like YbhB/YbcL family protein
MPTTKQKLQVWSNAFEDQQPIPREYSAYFDNHSPQISWSEPPKEAQSIAILCEDPDAPREKAFVHWMVANLPTDKANLNAKVPNEASPPMLMGGIQGVNDAGSVGYFGPRPPAGHGVHHYHFYVFALDTRLDLNPGFTHDEFVEAIRDRVIAQGSVVCTYEAGDEN